MSMTRDARDTAASLFYLERLNRLRETHLEKSLAGETIPPDFWAKGEAEALAQTRREFFVAPARAIFLTPNKAASLNDDQDFDARATRMHEMAMLETHRLLTRIPWVGNPVNREEQD